MADDEELQRRLRVLKEEIEAGRLHIASHIAEDLERSMLAVKYSVDGSFDLATVDARVRAMALAVTATRDREDVKKAVPLRDVQAEYFGFIERHFGELYKDMLEFGHNPNQVAYFYSQQEDDVAEIVKTIPDFLEELQEFWNEAVTVSIAHLQDGRQLKGVFGGDLFPSHQHNIASSTGLYLDTIVLTEPYLQSAIMFDRWSEAERVRYFVKHGLNLLQYKALALAEVDPPIVAVVPYTSAVDEGEAEFLARISEPDALRHAHSIFGRPFSEVAELIEFVQELDTPQKVVEAIVDQERLLFDTTWTEAPEHQIERHAREQGSLMGLDHPGQSVAFHCLGRMRQANDILAKSRSLGGVPVVDAETSWIHFNWKLEYNAENSSSLDDTALHVVQGIQSASTGEMRWLGNIPPDHLISIRKEGTHEEIRRILSRGVSEITDATAGDFSATSGRVLTNIQAAFDDHNERLETLERDIKRFIGKDVGSLVATGTMEIAAAVFGTPLFGLGLVAANQLLDSPKLKEIPKIAKDFAGRATEIERSPAGMLFKHRDN